MSKAARTRQRILESAAAMLYDRGLAKFRVDELVAELGLTRQTFYRYFSSKNEILKAVVIESGKALSHAVFEELMKMKLPFRQFLAEGVIISVNMVKRDKNLQKILNEDVQMAINVMVSNFTTVEEELYPIIQPYVLAAQEQGIVRPEVSTRDIMRWVFRAFLSEMLLADLDDEATRRQYLIKMMTPAILVDETASTAA